MAQDIIYTDISKLNRELKAIAPELKKFLQQDIKAVAEPVKSAIKSAIPIVAPLHKGMGRSTGRLGWNPKTGKKPGDVRIVYRATKSEGLSSLVIVNAGSPVLAMIDMAGKRNPNGRNARGAAMIRNLGGRPSRYVWPAAEKALPTVEGKIEKVIADYCRRWNVKA
jgi:hypothetical protein